jgi:hypothetical protein
MTDIKESIKETFEPENGNEYELNDVEVNRDLVRVSFFGEVPLDETEDSIVESLEVNTFGFSSVTESREDEDEMVTVFEFRYRD